MIAGLLFMAGMRRSEVRALRWADVVDATDGDGVLVTVRRSKTNDFTVPTESRARRALAYSLHQSALLTFGARPHARGVHPPPAGSAGRIRSRDRSCDACERARLTLRRRPAHGYCLPWPRVNGITLAVPLCLTGFGRRIWVSFAACAAAPLFRYAAIRSSAMTGSSMR